MASASAVAVRGPPPSEYPTAESQTSWTGRKSNSRPISLVSQVFHKRELETHSKDDLSRTMFTRLTDEEKPCGVQNVPEKVDGKYHGLACAVGDVAPNSCEHND